MKTGNEKNEYFEDELHKLLVHLHKDIPSSFWHWSFDAALSSSFRFWLSRYAGFTKLIRSPIHPRCSVTLLNTLKNWKDKIKNNLLKTKFYLI